MAASMLDAAVLSGLGRSGSEARDMLSGETVVGGVELNEAELDEDMSVGVLLEKLDPCRSSESSSAIGASWMAAIVAAARLVRDARQGGGSLCKVTDQRNARNANTWVGVDKSDLGEATWGWSGASGPRRRRGTGMSAMKTEKGWVCEGARRRRDHTSSKAACLVLMSVC
jgi:hypothetical protein